MTRSTVRDNLLFIGLISIGIAFPPRMCSTACFWQTFSLRRYAIPCRSLRCVGYLGAWLGKEEIQFGEWKAGDPTPLATPHIYYLKNILLSVYNVKSLPGFSRTWTSDVFVMGCSASFHHRGTTKNRSPISVSLGLKNLSIPLSRKTKITLKESWKLVEPVKSEAGKAMFMR